MIALLVAVLWLLQTCSKPHILGGKGIFLPFWGRGLVACVICIPWNDSC